MNGLDIEDTELGGLLADLTNGTNVHPGIHLIAAGIRTIAEDPTVDLPALQLLFTELAGSADGLDVIGAIAHLIEHLTTRSTVVRALDHDAQKTLAHQGWLATYHLNDPTLRDPAARACAALDH